MRIIAKRKLREFWTVHERTKKPLNAWYQVVELAEWGNPSEVRSAYRSADPVGDEFVVFDICDNDYRLVVRVDYRRSIVYIWGVYTHAEYDRLDLKAIDQKIRKELRKKKRG